VRAPAAAQPMIGDRRVPADNQGREEPSRRFEEAA